MNISTGWSNPGNLIWHPSGFRVPKMTRTADFEHVSKILLPRARPNSPVPNIEITRGFISNLTDSISNDVLDTPFDMIRCWKSISNIFHFKYYLRSILIFFYFQLILTCYCLQFFFADSGFLKLWVFITSMSVNMQSWTLFYKQTIIEIFKHCFIYFFLSFFLF